MACLLVKKAKKSFIPLKFLNKYYINHLSKWKKGLFHLKDKVFSNLRLIKKEIKIFRKFCNNLNLLTVNKLETQLQIKFLVKILITISKTKIKKIHQLHNLLVIMPNQVFKS
jgi:hypothetical protein